MRHKILFFILFLICAQAGAQFVDFGRNKVQYSDFTWKVLYTEHFQIYYYEEEKELAEQGAYFAEDSYRILQQRFRHSLIDTVPLIFYSSPTHFKQTNTIPGLIPDGVGGFFEFIKGRVVIPFDGSLFNFRHVIRHELTHVFSTSKIASELRIHGKIVDYPPPLWFTEGLAEFYSTEWDAQAEMVLRDAVLNGYMIGLNDWEMVYGTFFMYKLGQRVLMYIAEKYGEEKITELMENIWYDDNFENVMKITIGKDYEEFDKEFLYSLKKKYFPMLTEFDSPSQVCRNILSDGFAHKPVCYWNGNKEEIYFIGNRIGYTSIFKLNPNENSGTELVVEGESSDMHEAFHYFRTGLDISRSGFLAFVTQKGSADALFIYDIKKNKYYSDYSFKNITGIGAPAWSGDSRYIAFSGMEFSGKSDIYIFDTHSEKLTRLTNDYYDDTDPCFSPDGKYIVFSSDRSSSSDKNTYNLFLYELSANAITKITNSDAVISSPHFSEEGKLIFTSDLGGSKNIWCIDSVSCSAEMKRVTSFTSAAFDPKWCGKDKIVFTTYDNGRITIKLLENVNARTEKSNTSEQLTSSQYINGRHLDKITHTTGNKSPVYKKRYSFDLATTALVTDPVFGSFAGGMLSLSDMLGNDRYNLLLYNNSNYESEFWKSFNVAVSRISLEKRLNYAYGIYHLSGLRYDLMESDFAYYERMYGGFISFSYPLSFFRRIETNTNLSSSQKDIDFINNRRSLILSNSISYVKDNSLWWYTGPIDGERLNITLGYTTDLENSNENYFSFLFDYRKYFRLGKLSSLAFRGQFFINEGNYARRYFTGGSWSLRGWPWISIHGRKLWQTNAELRFPLFDEINFRTPVGFNLGFPQIRGALYFDAGNCWDTKENYGYTRGSIGGGVRMNIFGVIVLRYDLGKRIEENFTKLQGNLYHQVFFGWDF
ncbi:MAG: PD40 domain-containing protein [Ignavibacteriae bacterium]|nr:PD40 domain-containing protein [Ignavibacteriota bacterium]